MHHLPYPRIWTHLFRQNVLDPGQHFGGGNLVARHDHVGKSSLFWRCYYQIFFDYLILKYDFQQKTELVSVNCPKNMGMLPINMDTIWINVPVNLDNMPMLLGMLYIFLGRFAVLLCDISRYLVGWGRSVCGWMG